MRSKLTFLFLATILLVSCAAPTPQATIAPQTSEVSETSEVLTPISTQTPASKPTSTLTPEPTLPTYGAIDPNVAEKLQAAGITVPEELKNPEYKLDLATEFSETHWCKAFGDLDIPITVIPEQGIAYGKYPIKGIGMTDEACTAYAEAHIKYMWIHYREYGNAADKDITLEAYVELLRQGRGGFPIPQYNTETGFFDKKATINPRAGYTRIISDNKNKELPLKGSTENSMLFYVDANGMVWTADSVEFTIESWMDPNDKNLQDKPYKRSPNLAGSLLSASYWIGFSSNQCLATDVSVSSCLRDSAKVEEKYRDFSVGIVPLYKEWLAKYEGGDHSAEPPMWIKQ